MLVCDSHMVQRVGLAIVLECQSATFATYPADNNLSLVRVMLDR